MKKVKLAGTLLLIGMFTNIYVNGQENSGVYYPEVGDTIIDHEFTDLDNFPKKSIKISDFKGKWLILDFWSRHCSGCIASFPKMDRLHKEFKDQVQIMMVGLHTNPDTVDQMTRDIYHQRKNIHNLTFTVAFDYLAGKKFDIGSLPTILVINPEGLIVAKTTKINEEQIVRLLQGERPPFKRQFSNHETIEYDEELPLLTSGSLSNGGADTSFLFRSLLMPYSYDVPHLYNKLNERSRKSLKSGRFEVSKRTLTDLYSLAYFGDMDWPLHTGPLCCGKYSRRVILEIKDSTDFIVDETTLKGLYSYSLIVPPHRASREYMMEVMQSDLNNYFPYSVTIQKRIMPAYHLIIIDEKKVQNLKTKGGKPGFLDDVSKSEIYGGYGVINHKLKEFILLFTLALPSSDRDLPIINKTGIDYNIDYSIEADMLSLGSVNEALAKVGLEIRKGTEEMKTIVIRDEQ